MWRNSFATIYRLDSPVFVGQYHYLLCLRGHPFVTSPRIVDSPNSANGRHLIVEMVEIALCAQRLMELRTRLSRARQENESGDEQEPEAELALE